MEERLFKPLDLTNTRLPAGDSNAILKPYSHGYLYGSSSVALVGEPPYTPKVIAAARNPASQRLHGCKSFICCCSWRRNFNRQRRCKLDSGAHHRRVLNAEYQRRWLDSVQIEDPKNPAGTRYGYGIAYMHWGPNVYYYHGGEAAGFKGKLY